ncbi:MAG: hypothetical protein ACI8S6_001753 [Myxococcota bacterium]|jgi:hypothetical protein
MSDDKSIILRQGGTDRFFYDRHGGSHIDKLLLCGPRSLLDDLRQIRYRPTPRPFFGAWMSGVVFIDVDTQVVWFWSSQYRCAQRPGAPAPPPPALCGVEGLEPPVAAPTRRGARLSPPGHAA